MQKSGCNFTHNLKARVIFEYLSNLMTKPTIWMCANRKLRSAWASAQSDQSSLCAKWVTKERIQAFVMRTAKTLIRLGGCSYWLESSLGAHAMFLFLSWDGSVFVPYHHRHTLWHIDNIYYFPQKTGFDFSCKLSPQDTVCMKYQIRFPGKK